MTKTYYPFATGAGRVVNTSQWSALAGNWLRDGVVRGLLNDLEVYADSSGMQVKVKSGVAYVQGLFFKSDAIEALPTAVAHATLQRIDRVGLRVDYVGETMDLVVLTGTPGAGAPPALTRNANIYEISLAQVTVDAAAATIAVDKVTDERGNPDVGGYAAGIMGVLAALSTTLPSAPQDGQLLYELDVDQFFGRINGAWQRLIDAQVIAGTDKLLISPKGWGDRPVVKLQSSVATNPGSTVYTVPVSTMAILRKVVLGNKDAANAVVATVNANGLPVVKSQPLGADGDLPEECFRILTAGQTVVAIADAAGRLDATLQLIELPSDYAGANFRGASGTNQAAGIFTAITATAAKKFRLYNLALENGATAQSVVVEIFDGVNAIRQFKRSLAANQLLNLMDEIQLEGGCSLRIATTQTLASWAVGGEETV